MLPCYRTVPYRNVYFSCRSSSSSLTFLSSSMSPKPQHRAHDNEEDAHFDPIKKFPTVDVNVDVDFDEDDLPTNVSKEEQLAGLPIKYLSGDPIRPLQATDEFGNAYKYALNPTTYSVIFILLVELLERFSFYG